MAATRSFAIGLTLALCWTAGARTNAGAAQAPRVLPCGLQTTSARLSDPPDVEMSAMPADADGDPELILAVHRDGDRFCYRYRLDGAVQTIAPTIRVRRGQRFALRIVNDIGGQSKGEFVSSKAITTCLPMPMPPAPVVQYPGYLNHVVDDRWMRKRAIDTNVHLHGFVGPAAEEDVFLSTLSTPMHACEYRVTVPLNQPPGTYLYHPHVHGGSDIEMAGGLAGAWIVEPDTRQIARADEHVLVMRYRLPAELDNAFVPDESAIYDLAELHEDAPAVGAPVPYDPFDPPAWPLPFPVKAGGVSLDRTNCNGLSAEGVVAIDGDDLPASLTVAPGRTQLLRIVNATSDSPKELELRDAGGKPVRMRVAELDGVPVGGNADRPLGRFVSVRRLMLSPAARASVLVAVAPGQTLTLASTHFCGGSGAAFEMPHDLLRIVASATPAADAGPTVTSEPAVAADMPASKLVAYARAHPSLIRRRAITYTEYLFGEHGRIPAHASYFITDTTDPNFRERAFYPVYRNGATVPDNPNIVVKAGTIEEWYLFNTTFEAHTFHIHQMPFVMRDGAGGIPETVDTAFVPAGTFLPNPRHPRYPLVKPSLTRIIVDFRHVRKGTFVYHCHMLFHEDRGMMGVIRVV